MFTSKDVYQGVLRLPSFRGKSRLEGLVGRALFRPTVSTVLHGLRMELDPGEYLQIELMKDGCLEPLTAALHGRLLRPGDSYVDVGAHVGFFSLVARHLVGPSGRVVAVDPQPDNCARLLANCRLNGFRNVIAYIAAAGAKDGVVTLSDQSPRDRARLTMSLEGVNDEARRFVVRLVSLGTLLEEQGLARVRLLKIDVEGYEPEVVAGLGALIDRVDHMVVEILGAPSNATGRSAALVDGLEGAGFRLHTVQGEPWTIGRALPENNVWAARPGAVTS